MQEAEGRSVSLAGRNIGQYVVIDQREEFSEVTGDPESMDRKRSDRHVYCFKKASFKGLRS